MGRGAGGGPEVARQPGARHSVADAAQARAQAQHQARTGGAARLQQNIFGNSNIFFKEPDTLQSATTTHNTQCEIFFAGQL